MDILVCIVVSTVSACFLNAYADHGADIEELKTEMKMLKRQLEEEKTKNVGITNQQRALKARNNEIVYQQRVLESKLDFLEKREQHNTRSKRQVVGKVAFSAYLNHDVTSLGPDHTIQFQGVEINEGNAYNPHTGVFTVPLDGVYFLTFTAQDYRQHRVWLKLVIDGQLLSSNGFTPNDQETMGSNTVLARLRKGQSVWVAVDHRESTGGALQGRADLRLTTFSGFYLYK